MIVIVTSTYKKKAGVAVRSAWAVEDVITDITGLPVVSLVATLCAAPDNRSFSATCLQLSLTSLHVFLIKVDKLLASLATGRGLAACLLQSGVSV